MVNGKLTEEQKRIVRALEDFDKFIVNASAGTGKTHALKAIAETYPKLKFPCMHLLTNILIEKSK